MATPSRKRSRPSSSDDNNPRPQKRQYEKLRDARKIVVQSNSPGTPSEVAQAADLALASGSLDVNAFTAARKFEITSLQNAMRSSKLSVSFLV
jgi:hypothetical protein